MADDNRPESPEERRESGAALSVIGAILWAFDVLVIFFLPAAFRLGHQGAFLTIVVVLAVVGLILIIFGLRRRAAG